MGWSRDSTWCCKPLWNMHPHDQQSTTSLWPAVTGLSWDTRTSFTLIRTITPRVRNNKQTAVTNMSKTAVAGKTYIPKCDVSYATTYTFRSNSKLKSQQHLKYLSKAVSRCPFLCLVGWSVFANYCTCDPSRSFLITVSYSIQTRW